MTWPLRPVNELCIFATDCVNKTAPTVDYETRFKMIRTTNVKGGFIDLDTVRYVTEETFNQWTRRSRPLVGDVVLTREAPVGEVGRVTFQDENVMLGQRLFQYRPDPNLLDSNYLAYVLQSRAIQGALHGKSFGATVPHIRVGDAETLPIPCPPLSVQRRIGDVLSSYDDLIENNERRIKLLEEAARRLYREWFVALRFPGHERGKVVDGVPQGWGRVTLTDIASMNESTVSIKNPPDTLRYLDISSVGTGVIHEATEYAFADAPGRARRKVKHGDTIWSCVRPNRRSYALIWEPPENLIASTGFAVLTPKTIPFAYLHLASTTDEFVGHLTSNATGAAYPAVTARDFESAELLKPSASVLEDFDQRVTPLLAQQEVLQRHCKTLQQARDALLPRLMSGALAV